MEWQEDQKVYCYEYGEGKIKNIFNFWLMSVLFKNRTLPIMCSKNGYTVHDETKRKIFYSSFAFSMYREKREYKKTIKGIK